MGDRRSSVSSNSPLLPRHDHTASHTLSEFRPDDPDNPRNFSRWKKWLLIGSIVLIDLSVSWGASGYSPASSDFAEDMLVSTQTAVLGLSLYVVGLGLGPMSLAPLSEYYGRSPIYILAYATYLLLVVATALVPNLEGFLILRFFSGLFSSVTVANFGGTIADLYEPQDTGYAMSLFLWAATCGSPTGYLIFSFVAQTRPWRHVFWAIFGVSSGFWVIMTFSIYIVGETRHSVLLLRRAAKEGKPVDQAEAEVPDELKTRGAKTLFHVALTRPFRFLFSEAIIVFGAAYNGYLYGLSFLFNYAFVLVFGPMGHGFDKIGVGLSFLGVIFGITMGPVTNIIQEKHFRKVVQQNNGHIIPEARVQMAKVAGVLFPLSLFWFAWSTQKTVHFMVPIIASAFWGWSFYTLILMTYTYTEDAYKTYSASALAGLGLVRNLMGGGFPLLAHPMFENLGYQWAGTILAFLAIVLVPIPFILEKHGKQLRYKSPWAREHMDDDIVPVEEDIY